MKKKLEDLKQLQRLNDELDTKNSHLEKILLNHNATDDEFNKAITDIEKIQKKIANYDSFYPSQFHKDFAEKLYGQSDFNLFKIENKDDDIEKLLNEFKNKSSKKTHTSSKSKKQSSKKNKASKKKFELSNTQNLLKNVMSPHTPYRSLLIFHGTGVGKTCTGITIAENLKKIIKDNKKKIYIIRYEEFKNQIFDIKNLKNNKLKYQCTKDTYVKELINKDKINKDMIEKCQDNPIYCDSVMLKINKLIKSYYDFRNVEKWARDTESVIKKTQNNMSAEQKHINKIAEIRKEFSDSVIIIDEAHHINSTSNQQDLKLIYSVLNDVLKYGQNIRLILLTATPLWDKPTDIISLLNYMLINDKRPSIATGDIFNSKGVFTKDGIKILKNKSIGYISYLRGEDPFKFPFRISAKYNVPNQLIKTYPSHLIKDTDVYTNIKSSNKFEVFDIIDATMSKEQKQVYNRIIELKKTQEEFSTVWSTETQISNFIYQTLEQANNDIYSCYGEGGFKAILNNKSQGSYSFKDEKTGMNFLKENIHIYSKKISMILENIEKSEGPVFIFSSYVWGGLCPIILALEMNGYRPYKSNNEPYLNNKYKSGEYKGDYVVKSGSIKSSHINTYISKKQNMVNENVKVFLGTETAAEGLNLYGYREVHVLEPHFNFSLIEQVIGRCIRNESHISLPIHKRNVSVYLYASTIGKDESVDLFKYRISESKALLIGKIEQLLKENAMDCYLNYYGNNIYSDKYRNKTISLITSHNKNIKYGLNDTPYSRICNYSKTCNFYCDSDKKKTARVLSSNKSPTKFITINNISNLVYKYKIKLINIVLHNKLIKLTDLKKVLFSDKKQPTNLNLYNELFNLIIISLLKDNKVYNNKGDYGKIILYNNFLKFLSVKNANPNIEFVEQYISPYKTQTTSEVDLRFYINKLISDKQSLEDTNVLNYKNLITNFEFEFEKIKYNLPNNKYIFNLKPTNNEIVTILFYKLEYDIKFKIITTILNNIITTNKLTNMEEKLFDFLKNQKYIIYKKELFKSVNKKSSRKHSSQGKSKKKSHKNSVDTKIYGFIICNYNKILIYKYNKPDDDDNYFEIDNVYANTLINYRLKKFKTIHINNLFAYITVDNKNGPSVFKIMDLRETDKKSQKGSKCIDKNKAQITKYYHYISNLKIKTEKKIILCNDLELLFMRKNKDTNKLWMLNDFEYQLYVLYS